LREENAISPKIGPDPNFFNGRLASLSVAADFEEGGGGVRGGGFEFDVQLG